MRLLHLEFPITALISSGAAICGCSAVAATQGVVEGKPHEVAAAIGTVVLIGTLAMFLYPLLWKLVPMLSGDPRLMGIFTGSTMHEVAGVVAVGSACSSEVATTALVTKLVRVCLLAPFLLLISPLTPRSEVGGMRASVKLPWFALALVGFAGINSVCALPAAALALFAKASASFCVMAMAANGVDADLSKVRKLGPRPLLLAGALWMHLLVFGGGCSRLLVHILPR